MSDEWRREHYKISSDRSQLNTTLIHDYLSNSSYWATGRSLEAVERSIENSLCFGLYEVSALPQQQIGFARVVTDRTTFAYLADVYVLESHRGKGLSKRLIAAVCSHPYLRDLRRFVLWTRDAHGLYEQFGFERLGTQPGLMGRLQPFGYSQQKGMTP